LNQDKILILGIGNLLLGDEGVGCHAVEKLKDEIQHENVELVDGGTGGFHLLSYFSDYSKMILIDAALDNNPIGTITLLKPKFASDFPTALSAHDIGLRDLIETAILSGGLPEIHLIAVSIKTIQNMQTTLSEEIQKTLPKISILVKELLEKIFQ